MRTDRLVSILTVLLRRGRVPARELAERFEVSARTILRDVEALNLAGIPIVTFPGTGGGIGLAEGFVLDRSVLTDDEMAALLTGLEGAASALDNPSYGVILDKFRSVIPQARRQAVELKTSRVSIDFSTWGKPRKLKDALELLRGAIESCREVSFSYVDAEGRLTQREAQPYMLLLKGRSWYLHAWCKTRGAFRLFKLVRMRDLALRDTAFTRVEPVPAPGTPQIGAEEPAASSGWLVLSFDSSAENTVIEWFDEAEIERKDGRLIVRSTYPENKWLYGFLLSFGPELEVLEPEHLREIVKKMAWEIVQKY